MDLGTIKVLYREFSIYQKKLEENIYSAVQEVLYDLDAIWLNCYKYNGVQNDYENEKQSNTEISRLAKVLQNKYTDELNQIYNDCKND